MKYIYRYKKDKQLYTIQHLIVDMRFLNGNDLSGIYASPYKHKAGIISHTKGEQRDRGQEFEPLQFVNDNFYKVAELITL